MVVYNVEMKILIILFKCRHDLTSNSALAYNNMVM